MLSGTVSKKIMSREIKFRALCYADDVKRMIYFGLPEFDNGLFAWPMPNDISHIDEYVSPLMQYTGLKDKNGKDIYEGDIVQWGHLRGSREDEIRIAAVEMNPDIQFNCKNIKYPHVFRYGNFAYNSSQLEIVGNIYENPELINGSH